MCEYDDISRLDSYVHTVYDMLNDDERSRLDCMRISNRSSWQSRTEISMRLSRLIIRIAQVSTRFLCVDSQKFLPVGLTNPRPCATLAKSTIPRHLYNEIEYTFYSDYPQIPFRLPNHINHSFIFNKPFNKLKSMIFGII